MYVYFLVDRSFLFPEWCWPWDWFCSIIPRRSRLPFLIEHLRPHSFREERYADAVGLLIKTLRELSRLEWLKVPCPKCGKEMTQYLTPQEEVDDALQKAGWLKTVCSYCQNKIRLDARTFDPMR